MIFFRLLLKVLDHNIHHDQVVEIGECSAHCYHGANIFFHAMAKSVPLLKSSWDEFTTLVAKRWPVYGWYVLLRFMIGALFVMISIQMFLGDIRLVMGNPAVLENSLFWLGVLPKFIWLGLLFLALMLVEVFLQFGFFRIALNPKAEQSIPSLLSQGKYRYWYTLGVSILLGILMFLAIGLGFFLLILPGIFLLVMLCFAPIFVVMDEQGPIEALKSSWKMVKGRWWSVFGTLLFWIVLSAIAMWVINFLFTMGFLSALNPMMMEQFSQQMNAAAMRGDIEQVRVLVAQIFGQLLHVKTLLGFSLLVLAQTVVAIVPTYGVLSVYKVLRVKAKRR